jgi:hypothetical protein
MTGTEGLGFWADVRLPRIPAERRDLLGGLIHEYRWAA